MPCPVRVFDERDRDEAAAWLAGLPEGPGASVRLAPESGVVVIEVAAPLRVADFDALAATVDDGPRGTTRCKASWCTPVRSPAGRTSGSAPAPPIRARPSSTSRRVALAVDGPLADLAPAVADHFVQAQLRHFGHDELEAAIAWAAGRDGAAGPTPPHRTVQETA